MEPKSHDNAITKNESVKILARKEVFLEGIKEVINVNENEFVGKLKDCNIQIRGTQINLNKLDLEKEYVQISGNISSLKYANQKLGNKLNIKKLFN